MDKQVPIGWVRTILGELLLRIEAGKSFTCESRPASPTEWGVIKVSAMTWGSFLEAENKAVPASKSFDRKNEIRPGDVLLSRSNTEEHVGASVLVGLCRERLLLSDKSMRLVYSASLSPQWLQLMLASPDVRAQISANATGTSDSMRNVSQDKLRAIWMLLPPRAEQDRIASKVNELISSIEEGERALERVRKLVERYRQSVLKAAVTGELTREWREQHADQFESGEALSTHILEARRKAWEEFELVKTAAAGQRPRDERWKLKYEEPDCVDTTSLGELPPGWAWASLSQLSWSSSYGSSQKCAYGAPGLPVLRIPNIRQGRLDLNDIKNSTAELGLESPNLLRRGDLLVIRTNGSPQILGIGVAIESDPPFECYFASYAIRFRLVLPDELAAWVNICWQSDLVRSFVGQRKATSAGQYNIAQTALFELCLPIPPLAERNKICDLLQQALSQVEAATRNHETVRLFSTRLRQSILAAAFSGQLVSQDPDDEPASALLERIAAERVASAFTVPTPRRTRKRKVQA